MNPFQIDESDHVSLAAALPAIAIMAGELSEKAGELTIFGKFGLSLPHYSILSRLAACSQQPTMTELRDTTFMMRSSARMTGIVDDLENHGLVRRIPSASDRRVHLIEITETGRELITKVDAYYFETTHHFFHEFSLEELRTTLSVLRRFSFTCARILGLDSYAPFSGPVPDGKGVTAPSDR